MHTTFGPRDGMDLVEDHRARRCEHSATTQRRQHDVERFRRRDENVRRLANHLLSLAGRCVSRAYRHAYFREFQSCRLKPAPQFRKRTLKVALDVVVERLEW